MEKKGLGAGGRLWDLEGKNRISQVLSRYIMGQQEKVRREK